MVSRRMKVDADSNSATFRDRWHGVISTVDDKCRLEWSMIVSSRVWKV